MKKIAVLMGSDSDLPVIKAAFAVLREYGVPFEAHVMSAHRSPEAVQAFASAARERGFGAILAAAGKAAHLAGAVAANTTLPVIGIPVKSSTLDGLDALLATVQMPSGMPVATVATMGQQTQHCLRCKCLPWRMMCLQPSSLQSVRPCGSRSRKRTPACKRNWIPYEFII